MWIKELLLKNYRNYDSLQLLLNENINIFIGDNAQGKTNLLESIYLLAMGKSYRSSKDIELIKHKKNNLHVKGKIVRNAEFLIEIIINDKLKQLRVNKKKVQPKNFIGECNVVLFTPDDLQLVKGSPSQRRKFIDVEISQVNPIYRNILLDYQKVNFQRNKLLKDYTTKKTELIEIWDQQLIEFGSKIMLKRAEVIHKLQLLSRLMHRKISNSSEELALNYRPFFLEEQQKLPDNCSLNYFQEQISSKIQDLKDEEYKRGYSLVGPQRDDIQFTINDLDVKLYASQGQQRTAVLACRLAEMEFMYSEIGKYPIVLLDDVMSELDEVRKRLLLDILQKNVQTIITTTNLNNFTKDILDNALISKIDNGTISTI